MQFNSESNGLDMCTAIDFLCDTDSTSFPVKKKALLANVALETLISKILACDGTWKWDDSNNSDLPIGTQTLVASQAAYTFNDKFLQILNMKVKDSDGNWHIVKPIDQSEIDTPLEELYDSDGLPEYYDKITDDTFKVYPSPSASSCTLTNGLKIEFTRTAHLFAYDDTTAVPGIASPWHMTICRMVALEYCKNYKKDRVQMLELDITREVKDMLDFYSLRQKDVRHQLTPLSEDNR